MNIYSLLRTARRKFNDARGLGRRGLRSIMPQGQDPVSLPTMNDWWELTSKFPQFRTPSLTTLKDFGYMAVMDELGDLSPGARVLEFGHGFNNTILSAFEGLEVWGVDDYLPLPYNPPRDEWESHYEELRAECPRAKLIRGTIGNGGAPELPPGSFDVICSISVLEELRLSSLHEVLEHAHSLLREGGLMINTHDWRVRNTNRFEEYLEAHRNAGFDLGGADTSPPSFDLDELLLEAPTVAMSWYQGSEGEHRRYRGHWTTILTKARKP